MTSKTTFGLFAACGVLTSAMLLSTSGCSSSSTATPVDAGGQDSSTKQDGGGVDSSTPMDSGTVADTSSSVTDTGSTVTDTGSTVTDTGAAADTGSTVTDTGAGADSAITCNGTPTTHDVQVGGVSFSFTPSTLTICAGDTVHWVWMGSGHTVTSGTNGTADNKFCNQNNMNCSANPTESTGNTYDFTFATAGTFPYFCRPHASLGMTGTITVQ